ncbi:MAG: DNA polymerase ligase N-terminal domain-containing protein [Methanomicrobiaceae archaeon]|nr:DNA polymerase ligase N-terminal domain-containing protein [Methanomicrobiaceae archaeon]
MTHDLNDYAEKRDFAQTPEPQEKGGGAPDGGKPAFVIQKHQSSTLHYDFRLEVRGVLTSWAVPKGPSMDPRQKRLAVPTEDHPLAYAEFEGVIPDGEYGAGTVIVWDRGTYRNLRVEKEQDGPSMEEALAEGKVEVWLEGEKVRGGFALIQTGNGEDARWLLIKLRDGEADARRNPVATEPDSVLSGRSIEEVRDEEGRAQEKN